MNDRCNDLGWYRHVHKFVFEPKVAWKSATGETCIGTLWLGKVRRRISVLGF